jgi:hypothetical protein
VSEQTPALAVQSLALLDMRGLAAPRAWLLAALAQTGADVAGLQQLRIAIAQAPRKLSRGPLALTSSERERAGLPARLEAPSAWQLADLGRVALLLRALEQAEPARQVALVHQLLRTGELGEQASLLRGFALLPEPARFVALAVDACRTNAASVFSAIALGNPYPAEQFAPLNFNQMVLKALFMGLPVTEILELESRATLELRRMVFAFASERRAAGRPIPPGVEFVANLCPPEPDSSSCHSYSIPTFT